MCGIIGEVGASPDESGTRRRMQLLHHRGPDASGFRAFPACALGHTRLRIVDLSPAGDQPMSNETGDVWVVFNGEIYNHLELRRRLEQAGHRFRSHTDTEVLVHLYEEHGDDLVSHLRGMFAFALWDPAAERLLLARDRLGIKPLYYTDTPGGLRFGSEVRAIAESGPSVDPAAVASYLRLGWVSGPGTIYQGVNELPPGHRLVWQRGATTTQRYWQPTLTRSPASIGELTAALEDAVDVHLQADVPVGLFLSSGLDSSALAILTARMGADVGAFTVAFDDGADEVTAAAALARRLGLAHHPVPVRDAEVVGSIDRIISDLDQPSVDGVNSWVISRAIRDAGIVVALSGLGGDELFRGYSTFHHAPRISRIAATTPRLLSRVSATAMSATSARWSRAARVAEALPARSLAMSYSAVRGLLPQREVRRIWPAAADTAASSVAEASDVALLELANYLPNQLLRDTDSMSMAHSIEVRVPLLDDRVVEVALRSQDGIGGLRGKKLLAAAVDPTLSTVAAGPKRTFTLPFERWLRTDLTGESRESLAALAGSDLGFDASALNELWSGHQAGRVGWRSVWALTVLGRWISVQP